MLSLGTEAIPCLLREDAKVRCYRIRPPKWAAALGLLAGCGMAIPLMWSGGVARTYPFVLIVCVIIAYNLVALLRPDWAWIPTIGFIWQKKFFKWQGYEIDPPLDDQQ